MGTGSPARRTERADDADRRRGGIGRPVPLDRELLDAQHLLAGARRDRRAWIPDDVRLLAHAWVVALQDGSALLSLVGRLSARDGRRPDDRHAALATALDLPGGRRSDVHARAFICDGATQGTEGHRSEL